LKKYIPVISFILLAIISTYLYAKILLKKSPELIWGWYNSVSATLISVLLAVSIGIAIFFFQNSVIQQQEKEKYIFILNVELAATWQGLQTIDNPLNIKFENETYSFYVVYLQSIILEEAARSGLFNKEETRTLLKLTRYISFHNMNLNLLVSVIPQLNSDALIKQKIKIIWDSHIKTRNEIIKDIQIANRQFQLPDLAERIKKLPPQNN